MRAPDATPPPSSARLQRLAPVELIPSRVAARSPTLTALQRIDAIEIARSTQRDGARRFVVDAFFQFSRTRIPVRSTPTRPHRRRPSAARPVLAAPSRPDLRAERSFTDFRQLRDQIYKDALTDHGLEPCAFCSAVVDCVLVGAATPRAYTPWLLSERKQMQLLTQFINDVLALAVRTKAFDSCGACSNQERIRTRVLTFLSSDTERDDVGQDDAY